jgi:DNA (cytosine-5)-methyltransferase 1
MLRAIREIQPSWVVGENVRGLTNWNGGLVFDEVQAELEAEGYEVLPFLLPACAVNAPHRRDRIWFVAHSNGSKQTNNGGRNINEEGKVWRNEESDVFRELSCDGDVADTECEGLFRGNKTWEKDNINGESSKLWGSSTGYNQENNEFATNTNSTMLEHWDREGKTIRPTNQEIRTKSFNCSRKWESFPTVSPICFRDDGISNRLDGITFPKWRQESIKAGGNAIVPQVVYQIFKAIEEYESLINSNLTAKTAVKP